MRHHGKRRAASQQYFVAPLLQSSRFCTQRAEMSLVAAIWERFAGGAAPATIHRGGVYPALHFAAFAVNSRKHWVGVESVGMR
jgi:hypothetical protein